MEVLFLNILNRSIAAGWLILALLVLRGLLKNAPKWTRKLLWALAAVRLVLPEMLPSVLSLIPSKQTIPEEILLSPTPSIDSGISYLNGIVNPVLQESMAPAAGASVNPMQIALYIGAVLWLFGVACMALYALVSWLRLRRKLREAVKDGDVYLCDRIPTPFLMGIFKPKIYMPTTLADGDRKFVLAHEQAHIRGLDHIWKPLGFCLLAVHWFNPLVWMGYGLFCRDLELSCDERVIRTLDREGRKAYSNALLGCSASRGSLSACPLAFGEVGVKGRILQVLHYKKPTVWLLALAVAAILVTAVCFLTDPPGPDLQQGSTASTVPTEATPQEKLTLKDSVTLDPEEVLAVKKKLGSFFDLDTSAGLRVYVWQMGPGGYNCVLTSGSDGYLLWNHLLERPSASEQDMWIILHTYDISPEHVQVIPVSMPHSSYIGPPKDEVYMENLRKLLLDSQQP